MVRRTSRQKALVVMAVLNRQIQEARSVRHLAELMHHLSKFVPAPINTIVEIYKNLFVGYGKGYYDAHPEDNINELGCEI